MKRMLLVAVAVLVPFAVLVAWGLSALREEPVAMPPTPRLPEAPAPPVARAPVPAPPPPALEAAPASPEPKLEPAAALIAQLAPMVNTCFLDQHGPLKQALRISATFEPQPNGTLMNVQVKMRGADPYLVACVQDTLEGAQLDLPSGMPQGPMRHTFTYDPEGKK